MGQKPRLLRPVVLRLRMERGALGKRKKWVKAKPEWKFLSFVCNCQRHGALRFGNGKVLIGFIYVRVFGRRNGKTQTQACLCMRVEFPVCQPSISVQVQRVKADVFVYAVRGVFKAKLVVFYSVSKGHKWKASRLQHIKSVLIVGVRSQNIARLILRLYNSAPMC